MFHISSVSMLLHREFPEIPIYTDKVSNPQKKNFQIVILNTMTTPIPNDRVLLHMQYSIIYTTDSTTPNTDLLCMQLSLATLFLQTPQVLEFNTIENQLHCITTYDCILTKKEAGELLENLHIETNIR